MYLNNYYKFSYFLTETRRRDSSVAIATGYGLAGRGVRVRVLARARFSLLHVVQSGSGHPLAPTYSILTTHCDLKFRSASRLTDTKEVHVSQLNPTHACDQEVHANSTLHEWVCPCNNLNQFKSTGLHSVRLLFHERLNQWFAMASVGTKQQQRSELSCHNDLLGRGKGVVAVTPITRR